MYYCCQLTRHCSDLSSNALTAFDVALPSTLQAMYSMLTVLEVICHVLRSFSSINDNLLSHVPVSCFNAVSTLSVMYVHLLELRVI